MKIRCNNCRSGIIEHVESCTACSGLGYLGMSLGVGGEKGEKCKECRGKGKLITSEPCEDCEKGWMYVCDFCGVDLQDPDDNVCSTCEESPIAIELASPLDHKYLDGTRALAGRIINSNPKGVLVDLNVGFVGHFKSTFRYNRGSQIVVRLKRPISPKERGNDQTVPVVPIDHKNYRIVKKYLPVKDMTIEELRSAENNLGKIFGVISGLFDIPNGPTLFDITDKQGNTVKASIFINDNDKSFAQFNKNTVVHAILRYRTRDEQERIQLYQLEKAHASDSFDFFDNLATVNREDGSSLEDTEFFVDSNVYDGLKPEIIKAATRIRKAVLSNQNILLRYHSPCIDGATGAYAIDYAIRRYMFSRNARKDEIRRSIRRFPQRNQHFELREAARDLSFALDDGLNPHIPLYILVDVGSSEESKAAIEFCKGYDIDVIIIDHHNLDDAIKEVAYSVINPMAVEKSSTITSGMIATELAKFIAVEHDLSEHMPQIAAIAGVGDNSDSIELSKYLEAAEGNEYGNERIDNIVSALDYLLFNLRHFDGGEVIRNVLGLTGHHSTHTTLIESVVPTAKSLFASALAVFKNNVAKEELSNGTVYQVIDFELYGPKFDYPNYSTLMAKLHFDTVEENEKVVTIGLANDYLIIRNSDPEFVFEEFLTKLSDDQPEYFINGAGHQSYGSIQYYTAFKENVIEMIKESFSA